MFRRISGATMAGAALALALAGPAAAQNEAGDSLINVQISDVEVLVPIGIAANLCDINANILALQDRTGGADCKANAESVASPGSDGGNGADNTAGDALVNVQLSDITVLVPISAAANLCDININALAQQFRQGGASCKADSSASA